VREERASQKIIKSGPRDRAAEAAFKLGNCWRAGGTSSGPALPFRRRLTPGTLNGRQQRRSVSGNSWTDQATGRAPSLRGSKRSTPGTCSGPPAAGLALGVLRANGGDLEGARAAWERAVRSGHAEYAPTAALNLGDRSGPQRVDHRHRARTAPDGRAFGGTVTGLEGARVPLRCPPHVRADRARQPSGDRSGTRSHLSP
jgi:hypothetical protein